MMRSARSPSEADAVAPRTRIPANASTPEAVVIFVPDYFVEGLLARMEGREPQIAEDISASTIQTSGPVPASPAPASTSRR